MVTFYNIVSQNIQTKSMKTYDVKIFVSMFVWLSHMLQFLYISMFQRIEQMKNFTGEVQLEWEFV